METGTKPTLEEHVLSVLLAEVPDRQPVFLQRVDLADVRGVLSKWAAEDREKKDYAASHYPAREVSVIDYSCWAINNGLAWVGELPSGGIPVTEVLIDKRLAGLIRQHPDVVLKALHFIQHLKNQ